MKSENKQAMNVKDAYKKWAHQYDTNNNKTRDLEAIALRETLNEIDFNTCLEVGCGTGKNTAWLITKAKEVTAVDLSEEMLSKAKAKLNQSGVTFIQANINEPWNFVTTQFDLISFSLVLEHIENLDYVFQQASLFIKNNGYVYIGELHPFKQYSGSKARFQTEQGEQIVACFTHHISDFIQPVKKYGFEVADVNEYFDDNNRNIAPRIVMLLLKKSN